MVKPTSPLAKLQRYNTIPVYIQYLSGSRAKSIHVGVKISGNIGTIKYVDSRDPYVVKVRLGCDANLTHLNQFLSI